LHRFPIAVRAGQTSAEGDVGAVETGGAVRSLVAVLDDAFARRAEAGMALVGEANAIALASRAVAERFRAGGRLLAFGGGGAAPDAQHVAVEFLHPVTVGKPALPALALNNDVAMLASGAPPDGGFAESLRVIGTSGDVALGLSLEGRCTSVVRGLECARQLGMLTLALTGGAPDAPVARAADQAIVVRAADPLAAREALVTAYHVLWELVHVFLERPAGPGRS
jgi:D-sedoheptulose 7-phosphate isomerase